MPAARRLHLTARPRKRENRRAHPSTTLPRFVAPTCTCKMLPRMSLSTPPRLRRTRVGTRVGAQTLMTTRRTHAAQTQHRRTATRHHRQPATYGMQVAPTNRACSTRRRHYSGATRPSRHRGPSQRGHVVPRDNVGGGGHVGAHAQSPAHKAARVVLGRGRTPRVARG